MRWISANDRVPADQQEVLVKISGQVSLAKFSESEKIFKLRDGTSVHIDQKKVDWMELIAPYQQ